MYDYCHQARPVIASTTLSLSIVLASLTFILQHVHFSVKLIQLLFSTWVFLYSLLFFGFFRCHFLFLEFRASCSVTKQVTIISIWFSTSPHLISTLHTDEWIKWEITTRWTEHSQLHACDLWRMMKFMPAISFHLLPLLHLWGINGNKMNHYSISFVRL